MDKVYNPETKRYIKRDSKKGIEILFKNKDKDILKSFELINGKIVKKCLNGKIRNLKTLRCINKKLNKEPNKKLNKEPNKKSNKEPNSLKREAVNKIKKAFSPFLKRISGDIYTRVRYMMMMRRELKQVLKEGKGCLKIYKENPDGTFKYRIGSNIILNKKIGSESVYGEAYLSEFRDKSKKLLTFVSKIYQIDDTTNEELKILELLSNKVRKSECPHFPITYGYVKCEKLSDSYKKSNSKELSLNQDLDNYPIVYQNIVKNNGILITLFNELANGDLKSFLTDYQGHTDKILNSLIQILLSIIFFYYHTDKTHNDCHWGNFLYHNIKKGGYFHYKIFGEDYYLENIGFLWVIWDFDFVIPIRDEIINNDKHCFADFDNIIKFYLPNHKIYPNQLVVGKNRIKFKEDMKEIFDIVYLFYKDFVLYQDRSFVYGNLMNFILNMLKYFKDNKWLLTKLPSGSNIINKEPFIINNSFINRH